MVTTSKQVTKVFQTSDTIIHTLQEHQRIRTNATVSKDSDFSVLMVVYEIFFFTFFKQISEINK